MMGRLRKVGRPVLVFLMIASSGTAAADDQATKTANNGVGRILRKQVIVKGPLEEVWRCWTTSEGIASFFSPESNIRLEIGGPYELFMRMSEPDAQGRRGSEGCKVLSYIPHRMLAFEWNFPPAVEHLRAVGAKTQVVLQFDEAQDGHVRMRFAQLGWQEGEDWDRGYEYFDTAWTKVMSLLQERMAKSATISATVEPKRRSWEDGQVKVTATESPYKNQEFELILPAPVKEVWKLLSTAEGLKRIGSKEPTVELKPGGAYCFWPGAPNRVLAFVPNEVLSTSGSAPEQFPNVRKGGTWGAYFFEPTDDGKTKLRLTVLGWRSGEKEWDDAYDYFLKANTQFLNHVHTVLSGADRKPAAETAKRDSPSKERPSKAGDVLRHEGIINAPVADVWAAFTTKEGIESWMVPHAEIDLRVGGLMRSHYDPKGVLGDENTIENTILTYEPLRMLSLKATKPPANFPFKAAIENTWSVIHFEPIGADRTRIVTIGLGYGDDEESRKMRSFFDQGNDWTLRQLAEKFSKQAAGSRRRKPTVEDDVYRTAAEDATDVTHLSPLARVIGAWKSVCRESDGGEFHAKVVFEWGLRGKIIKCRSYVVKEGDEQLVYESFLAWHPGKKQIIGLCFSAWDAMYDGEFDVTGNIVKYTWKSYTVDKVDEHYQTMDFTDQDTCVWTVFTKKDSEWVQSKQATYERIKDVSARTDTGWNPKRTEVRVSGF